MDMQASKEFLAELKVLTHVHHLNLVMCSSFCNYKKYRLCIWTKIGDSIFALLERRFELWLEEPKLYTIDHPHLTSIKRHEREV